MPARGVQHTREWDRLVAQLQARGDVENPYALATWILESRDAWGWEPPEVWIVRSPSGDKLAIFPSYEEAYAWSTYARWTTPVRAVS